MSGSRLIDYFKVDNMNGVCIKTFTQPRMVWLVVAVQQYQIGILTRMHFCYSRHFKYIMMISV